MLVPCTLQPCRFSPEQQSLEEVGEHHPTHALHTPPQHLHQSQDPAPCSTDVFPSGFFSNQYQDRQVWHQVGWGKHLKIGKKKKSSSRSMCLAIFKKSYVKAQHVYVILINPCWDSGGDISHSASLAELQEVNQNWATTLFLCRKITRKSQEGFRLHTEPGFFKFP